MEQKQQIASTARVARGAVLVGEVTLGEESSVWYNAVVRADNAPIVIGARSNIQDCCVLHVDEGHPIQIGDAGDASAGWFYAVGRTGQGAPPAHRGRD